MFVLGESERGGWGWGALNYDFICLVDEKVKDQTEKEQKISD
jgi:hypothetical protein